ncbi:sigma-70 family RNA polymerase sigma factor [Erythrobacter dokdonensis]|uniref:Flagellar-specific RNA polymerase sigma factor n=1 Tax=Erythrobacter dokdonensis DSW-74 TaxID=1300349 RepID=A0A1A7BEG2_9SPHN|nr:sigma-70 family RNA polymerase sigma factor [Erythrobacter dokdonensis]OBV10923.1 Flagellar-specific RNA polymerase sigma factor [Erythrobacter dokdonensis DSW-74]
MKHDHTSFAAATSYCPSRAEVEDRVRRFLPLVRRAAWHIHGSGRDGLEIEDLVQAGIVALTECAQRHTGPTEDGFAAYAKIRVRGAMLDEVRRAAHDTRTARRKRAAYDRALEALRGQLGREPSRSELARTLKVDDAGLLAIESAGVTLTPISEEYDEHSTAFASEDPDPFEALCAAEDRERLLQAMIALPDRLKLVLQLFFVEEMNLTEIAAVLEVSVPRVHQLRAKALKDLKALMEKEEAG